MDVRVVEVDTTYTVVFFFVRFVGEVVGNDRDP